jgi:vacuolar-type H+-ATPase subunit I/STV1
MKYLVLEVKTLGFSKVAARLFFGFMIASIVSGLLFALLYVSYLANISEPSVTISYTFNGTHSIEVKTFPDEHLKQKMFLEMVAGTIGAFLLVFIFVSLLSEGVHY